MYCPKCGAGPFEGKFCPKCGTPVSQSGSASQSNAPTQQNAEDLKNAAKTAAAGIGTLVAGAATSVADKAASAVNTAKANQQQRAVNIASGAAAQSSYGLGGLGGGLGASGGLNAARAATGAAMLNTSQIAAEMRLHFFYDIMRNRRYFTTPHPARPIALLILSIVGLLMTIPNCAASSRYGDSTGVWVGVLLLLVMLAAIFWLWWVVGRRPSDQEIDEMYARIAANGASEAAQKSDLDEEERTIVEPMVFSGPSRDNVPATAHSHLGRDGITRWSNFQMSTVFCTEDQLFYYSASQSLTIARREVTTMDVYYRDIALVEMREFLGGFGRMVIHTTSGDAFTVAYSHDQEESIRGLRSLLREKKAHVVVELLQD